jgi:putative tryptophan/tyrosine transport system substrate-binding protein
MRRRDFLEMIAASAWPLAARAQETGRIYRLGDLHLSPRNAPQNVSLFDTLKARGFVAGQNLVIDDRGFGLRVDELADHASAVVKAKVDVIVCAGEPALRAAQQATKTIPILAIADDMVKLGFVASLAKPGGNITGVSILSTELDGKRQDILLEALPSVRRIAAIGDADLKVPAGPEWLHEIKFDGYRVRVERDGDRVGGAFAGP